MQSIGFKKNIRVWIATIVTVVFTLVGASTAHAKELLSDFVVDIAIRPDGSFHVSEAITYDFGPNDRHGIFRNIPYIYETDIGSYKAELTDFEVTDANGTPYIFEEERKGNNIRLKIGDPDTTIRGAHTYVIQYDVHDALLNFSSFDELYWNVTGHEWVTPIRNVRGRVRFVGFEPAILDATCYRGPNGSNEQCDAVQTGHQAGAPVFEFLEQDLVSQEGVTIAVSFPTGFVAVPSTSERIIKFLKENGIAFLPVFAFGFMYWHWFRRGRDPKGRGAIVPQYEPPVALTPAEVGTLYDEIMHPKDITAEIIYLAVHGYLRIHQIEKPGLFSTGTDYILEKLNDPESLVNNFDRKLMEVLFKDEHVKTHEFDEVEVVGVALSDLKYELQSDIKKIQDEVYETVVTKKYFSQNPSTVRKKYIGWGIAVIGIGIVLGGLILKVLSPIAIISIIATGVIVLGFAYFMPAKTRKGALAYEHILGLRDYLATAETDRLKFHNDPERTPERFDSLLPFAMVMNVEKEWAALFEDIYKDLKDDATTSEWYSVPPGHSFMPSMLASNLGGLNSSVSSAAASKPSSSGSSGGGSSGGGFGGGGGGSW